MPEVKIGSVFDRGRIDYTAYDETPTLIGSTVRKFVYEFSILNPIADNNEFAAKVSPPLYPTFWSILNPMRLITTGAIAKLADQGHFMKSGRYRLEVAVEGMKYRAKLTRQV